MEDGSHERRLLESLNESLRENQARLAKELAAMQRLQSASEALLEGGDSGTLYQKLVDAAVDILQSDMGSMQVLDEGQNALRLLAWRGFGPEFGRIFEFVRGETRTSCGTARQTGHRVIVPDVETWELLVGTPELEDHRKMGIRAVQSTPLISRRGRLVGMVSTHWRTPHMSAESELRTFDILARQAADMIEGKWAEEATARLAAIVSSSDDAIVGKDLQGIITSWNKGAERLFGYTAEEMIGRPVAQLIPAERRDEEPSILDRIRRGERIDHYETVRQRKDGSLVDISITVSPVQDAEGRVIGAAKIARDITERKLAEESLIEADRRKNEFLAMLAHELRGPLAPVRNSLQIVRMHMGDGDPVTTAAAIMERQIGQMARLIDDLIDVSRISLGKLELRREPFELISAVRGVVDAAIPVHESLQQELTVVLPPQPIHVNADLTRIAQVVGNLLNNAGKFTDSGGHIWLTVEREGTEAVIRCRDSGIGITAENLPRIFDMFSQVDSSLERSSGGLGIGLSLVRRVVEMHGGTVTASSAGLGQGSEFVVRLPMMAERSEPRVAEPSGVTKATIKRRVLVVDDNRDSVESLALLLELSGHEVRTAHDGLEAVETVATFRPDLVLLDIGLPKLNGYEAALRIRELPEGRGVMLVALSGWGQDADRRRSEEVGFDVHLVKPVDPETLNRLFATVGSS